MVVAARLRRKRDISLVRTEGIVRSDRAFVLRMRSTEKTGLRLAVSAMRDVGGAVRRNRARRRVREAFRQVLLDHADAPSADLLVSVRRAALDVPAGDLRVAAAHALGAALGR